MKLEKNNRISGWISVGGVIDPNQKVCPDNLLWRLKIVNLDIVEKKLFISSLTPDDQDLLADSPAKSPGGIDILSPRTEQIPRTGSRPRLESQSSNSSFKQFFSRKLAISSRSRSVGKIGNQKSDSFSPRSPSGIWAAWRSADSEFSLEEEVADLCMDMVGCKVRPVHSSVLQRAHCFQLVTSAAHRFFSCNSLEEYTNWLKSMRLITSEGRDGRVCLDTSLDVSIIEAKGIPTRKRYFCEVLLDSVLFSRTSVKYKNDMLFWGEQYSFTDLPPVEVVTVNLFRESDTKKKRKQNIFVGSSDIHLNEMVCGEVEKWVSVITSTASPKSNQKNDQALVRVKLKYNTIVVLPLQAYQRLHSYVKKDYMFLANSLEKVVNLKTKDLLAQTLLKVLHSTGDVHDFLVDVIMNEVSNTSNENLIFRGNSLATKSIDTYMKLVGMKYLQETLGAFVATVYEMEDDAEVDPEKILFSNMEDVITCNQKNLRRLVDEVWKAIVNSASEFPKCLQRIFATVRRRCQQLKIDMGKKIVSASLFLRFLCPAILSPSLFQLTSEYPSEKVSRTLTLVAKTIQNLANFTRFGTKEQYMENLNNFVEAEMPTMDSFLQKTSAEPTNEEVQSCYVCSQIDLARELSIMYSILQGEIGKLKREQLDDLKVILNNLNNLYDQSPKADELRNFEQTNAGEEVSNYTHIYTDSKESRCDALTLSATPVECYDDVKRSFIEDYVPATDNDVNEEEMFRRSFGKRNKDGEVALRVAESKKKFDEQESPKRARNDTPPKKEGGSIRDRINMFSQGSSAENAKRVSRIPAPSDKQSPRKTLVFEKQQKTEKQQPLIKQPSKSSLATKEHKQIPKPIVEKQHSKALTDTPKTKLEKQTILNLNSEPQSPIRKLDSEKRYSLRHERSPRKHSTPTEDSKYSSDSNLNKIPPVNNSLKEKLDRGKLSLSSLTKAHKFADTRSPGLSTCSPLSSISESGRGSNDTLTERLNVECLSPTYDDSPQKPKKPVNLKNRCSDTSDLFYSKKSGGETRRYSQMAPNEVQREMERNNFNRDTMIVAHSREIAQIHSNGFCEILHEGVIERSNSIVSTYSTETYESSNSSNFGGSDDEAGVLIDGDDLVDALLEDQRIKCGENNCERRVSAIGMSLPRNRFNANMNENVETLVRKLRDKENTVQKLQNELRNKSKNFEQTVLHLRDKLVEANESMKAQKQDTDNQMKTVISRLMNMENELRREQTEMENIVKAKQKIIDTQERRIRSLEESNARLVTVLTSLKKTPEQAENT